MPSVRERTDKIIFLYVRFLDFVAAENYEAKLEDCRVALGKKKEH